MLVCEDNKIRVLMMCSGRPLFPLRYNVNFNFVPEHGGIVSSDTHFLPSITAPVSFLSGMGYGKLGEASIASRVAAGIAVVETRLQPDSIWTSFSFSHHPYPTSPLLPCLRPSLLDVTRQENAVLTGPTRPAQ